MSHLKRILAPLTLILGFASLPALAGDIAIHDPYMRTSGASTATGAAFMTIINAASTPDRLIAAATTQARHAALHTHLETADGIMMMREIEGGIVIPAGGKAVLKRGGDHVMLMGLVNALEQDAEVMMVLTFENAGEVTVMVPVDQNRKANPMGHKKPSDDD